MTYFPWKADYETGNPEIDAQHRELLRLANLLVTAQRLNNPIQVRKEAFNALFRYTEKHFKAEDAYWQDIASPYVKEQREEHRLLTKELDQLWANERLAFVETAGDELAKWVTDRLIPHMVAKDRRAARAGK